jgi:hypothetical protein
MEFALLGLVIDAERKKQPVADFIEAILAARGAVDLSLSPITVDELVHGIYRARTPEASRRRREYIEELVRLVPVHPVTNRTACLLGKIVGIGHPHASPSRKTRRMACLFHPWKREKSPAFHASRSPGVLRSQSGRISLVAARRSCQRSMTDGRPQNQ